MTVPLGGRSRWVIPALIGVAAVALLALATVSLPSGGSEATTATPAPLAASPSTFPQQAPLFGRRVGVLLVFDDGGDGVVTVDPDARLAAHRALTGHGGGDPPYRLASVADRLVVGWNSVYAVATDTGQSTLLGRATIYLPAAEPDRVWLVRYPQGFIGGGTPEVWQVDLEGRSATEPVALDEPGFPAVGVPGGLALETDDGVALWDAGRQVVTGRLGDGQGFVADASGSLLAWCTEECATMHVTDLATGSDVVAGAPEGEFRTLSFGARSARFSPDGRHLGALAGDAVVLVEVDGGAASAVVGVPGADLAYVGWSPDGRHLFASPSSFDDPTTKVAHYDLDRRRSDVVTLPFGHALSFVVIGADGASYLLNPADACRPAEGIVAARPVCVRF